MTIKQFKSRFKKHREVIASQIDKIRDLAEEVDDDELCNIVQEICDNVDAILIEPDSSNITDKTLIDYDEYLEYLETLEDDNDNNEYEEE